MPQPAQSQVARAAAYVRERHSPVPILGVVLGSGLGDFATELSQPVSLAYSEIPGMPTSSVPGHAGKLWLGRLGELPVACLQGRAHAYEGHSPERVVFGVRLLAELGCKFVIVTNAAGGIRADFAGGDLMLITDHLNLTGQNPLVGPSVPQLERFVDMTHAYDVGVADAARAAAQAAGVVLHEGTYAALLGPNYETPAEVRMLARCGADAVGMSTVLEVLALRQLGVRVGGLSLISNQAAGLSGSELSHAEVQAAAHECKPRLARFLHAWIAALGASA